MADDDITVEIEGLDELEEIITRQTPKAAKRALRRASRAAGEIFKKGIEDELRATDHPYATGFLETKIEVKSRAVGGDDDETTGAIVVKVGPNPKAAQLVGGKQSGENVTFKAEPHYAGLEAVLLEFGSKHQEAKPFARPAFENNKDKALDTFVEAVQDEIERLKK